MVLTETVARGHPAARPGAGGDHAAGDGIGTVDMDERNTRRLTSDAEIHSLKHGERRMHPCRNISRLGCMIADEGLAATTGEDIEIELREGIVVTARVIWARQGHVGLAFRGEIDIATLRHLASVDERMLHDAGLRDRFGRLLPDRLGKRAA